MTGNKKGCAANFRVTNLCFQEAPMEGTRLMSAYANQPAMLHHSACQVLARCCRLHPPQNGLAMDQKLARWNQNSSWTEKCRRLSWNPESECLVPCQAQVGGLAKGEGEIVRAGGSGGFHFCGQRFFLRRGTKAHTGFIRFFSRCGGRTTRFFPTDDG
jgi:hypothetical protein